MKYRKLPIASGAYGNRYHSTVPLLFTWARRLLPGHPDPRVNLAMTLESAGRNDDAMATYRTALEIYPDYVAAAQGLARLQIKQGKTDERTPALLKVIAMQGETREWREWAKGELTRVR
ncbi:MAG: tetratricopeptide repeat protein [Phycisphaeraceae bacterium]|nr:tetratricopeptide repeat protein [Phycisphaeraceae bacterium]